MKRVQNVKKYTVEEIEKGLTDVLVSVRRQWSARIAWGPVPTAEQVERGLKDSDEVVRRRWSENKRFVANASQAERGLTDEDEGVKAIWAARLDFTPTMGQVSRGMRDDNWVIRRKWACRMDFTPTPEQFERGLTDKDIGIRMDWEDRENIRLPLDAIHRVIAHHKERMSGSVSTRVLRLLAETEARELSGMVSQAEKETSSVVRAGSAL